MYCYALRECGFTMHEINRLTNRSGKNLQPTFDRGKALKDKYPHVWRVALTLYKQQLGAAREAE